MHIAKKLLAYYKKHYSILSNGSERNDVKLFNEYLLDHYLGLGICNCAAHLFQVNLSKEFWVRAHFLPDACYWWQVPFASPTIEEKLEGLQVRIDILERVVKAHDFYINLGIGVCIFLISILLILLAL